MKGKIKLPEGYKLKKLEDGIYEVIIKPFKLEVGKDYMHNDGDMIVIGRVGALRNSGFYNGDYYNKELTCNNHKLWREATKEEVMKFFERHLIKRYGEDWENVKINECMYWGGNARVNSGMFITEVKKDQNIWRVWNNNGCLFNGKEWAEVLEEKKTATDLSEIDRPYYIDSSGDTFRWIITQSKNHMTSEELCEGILALQQLIAFRDNFHEVHGAVYGNNHGSIRFDGNEFMACKIESVEVAIFDFSEYEQAKEFYETHKELFKELKKLY